MDERTGVAPARISMVLSSRAETTSSVPVSSWRKSKGAGAVKLLNVRFPRVRVAGGEVGEDVEDDGLLSILVGFHRQGDLAGGGTAEAHAPDRSVETHGKAGGNADAEV
jgi:uncharacterized protein YfaP (DUF2135 family)